METFLDEVVELREGSLLLGTVPQVLTVGQSGLGDGGGQRLVGREGGVVPQYGDQGTVAQLQAVRLPAEAENILGY